MTSRLLNSRFTAVICAIACAMVFTCMAYAYNYGQEYNFYDGDDLGYNCVYQSPWCGSGWFPAGYSHTLTASWFCRYRYREDNTWEFVEGPTQWSCTELYAGCCTMPADDSCSKHTQNETQCNH